MNTKVDDLMEATACRIRSGQAQGALLLEAQQIYVVDETLAAFWFGFGVSPILTVKKLTGSFRIPTAIPRLKRHS